MLWLAMAATAASNDARAQNLVPNPSFEHMRLCPTWSNITFGRPHQHIEDFCFDWQNVGTIRFFFSGAGGQYLHECAGKDNPPGNGIPQSYFAYQYARTGKAMAPIGFSGTHARSTRHFYGVQLTQPLHIGKKYRLSMYVNLADSSKSPVSHMGMMLYTQPVLVCDTMSFDEPSLPNWAHVYSPELLTDMHNWVLISGDIIADSAYTFLVIGNFFNFTKIHPSSNTGGLVQVLVDDVSVEEVVKRIANKDEAKVCEGDNVTLQAVGADADFFWSSNGLDTISTTALLSLSPNRNRMVYLVSSTGVDSVLVEVVPRPTRVLPYTTELCETDHILIDAYQTHADTYYLNEVETEAQMMLTAPGKYKVRTVSGSCHRDDEVEVYTCPSQLFIPNAFTPNGDGLNDVFLPRGTQIYNYQLDIYNRWGESIFKSNNIRVGWDGSNAPNDVYTYTIRYTDYWGLNATTKYGTVTLMR